MVGFLNAVNELIPENADVNLADYSTSLLKTMFLSVSNATSVWTRTVTWLRLHRSFLLLLHCLNLI